MIDCSKHNSKQIVKAVSSGDLDAFYCIVEKYEQKLLKYILRLTSVDFSEAENLLQEVFIKVYQNINSYDDSMVFSSWIYRITHNMTIDYHRKNKNKLHISLETDDDYKDFLTTLDSGINIKKDLEDKQLNEFVLKILDLLDYKYREVLVLKFLEFKSYEEISDILKIPTGTVATLINRAKKQFKQKAEDNNLKSYL